MVYLISSKFIMHYYLYIQQHISNLLHLPYLNLISLFIVLLGFAILLEIITGIFTLIAGWAERKIIARTQSRRGPVYVGKFGILQNMADAIKLIVKENIVPDTADKPLFAMILPAVYVIYFIALVFLPLTNTFVGIGTSIGLIIVFMLLSLVPLFLFLAGWTSGNKFGSISSQRSIIMLVSYEIPLLLVLAAVAMLSHTYNFTSIVAMQSHIWYILLMPIGFAIFFIITLAEAERPPFDLREADNELVSGWLTDVSAPYYALALFIDYTRMFVGALLITLLFLGGWQGPVLPPFAWLMIKISVITLLFIIIRATTFRLRLDSLLRLGWLYLLPAAVLNLFITFLLFIK